MPLTCKRNRDFFTHRLSCVKRKTNVLLIEELLVVRQLAELQDELDALSENRDNAQNDYYELTSKHQEQIRMRLTDAVFAKIVVDVGSMIESMPSELKADLDGEFLTAIAEQPNVILKCAIVSVPWLSRRRNPARPVMRRRWHLIRPPVETQSG